MATYIIYNDQIFAGYGATKTSAIANFREHSKIGNTKYGTLTVIIQTLKPVQHENEKILEYALPIEAKDINDLINQLKPYPEMAQEAAEKRIWENPPKAALQKTDGSQKTDAPLNWTHIGAAFATGAVLATVVTVLVK